jgi:hypothetical protein
MASTTFDREEIKKFHKLAVYILSNNEPNNKNIEKPLEGDNGFYYKVGQLIGVGESSIRNLYSDRKRGFTEDHFNSFCKAFLQVYTNDNRSDYKKRIYKIFDEWVSGVLKKRTEWENFLHIDQNKILGKNENTEIESSQNIALSSDIINNPAQFEVATSEFSNELSENDFLFAIQTIDEYYKQSQLYINEHEVFDIFRSFVADRKKTTKAQQSDPYFLIELIGWLTSSSWELYELDNDTIVKKVIQFKEIEHFHDNENESFMPLIYEIKQKASKNFSEKLVVYFTHNYLTIEKTPFSNENPILESTYFPFDYPSAPLHLVGHKISFDEHSGTISGKITVMKRTSRFDNVLDKISYSEHSIEDKIISDYVRALLLSPYETPLFINPHSIIHSILARVLNHTGYLSIKQY